MDNKGIRYEDVFHQSPLARMVIEVIDRQTCVFADVNPVAAEYFSMPGKDMLGKSFRELFPDEMAEHFEQSCQTCIHTKRSVAINALPQFPGGLRVQSFMLSPILNKEGDLRFINVVARPDSADNTELEQERDDAILLLTSLFDASGLGIIVTDQDGIIVRVNDAFLEEYDWDRDELLDHEFTTIIPPEDQALSKKLHSAFISKGRNGSREIQIVRRDGSLADILLSTVLLQLSQHRRYMVSTIRDITERKNMIRNLRQAKEQADIANKAKSSFLANMSHELRTPLNAIIGFSELIMSETFGPMNNDKYSEYMTDIHFSARHLLDIINDVLDMSKIESGKVELVESEIIIEDVFNSVSIIMNERAAEGGVNLIFEIADDIPHLRADQRLLRQILINLVSNAIKFTPKGKKVTVRAYMLENGRLRLSVDDEGCGIPEDKIEVVLEPFGQAHDPLHSKGQGTGLGLPLAKTMVELHGGELEVISRVDRGTYVSLDFREDRLMYPGDKLDNDDNIAY